MDSAVLQNTSFSASRKEKAARCVPPLSLLSRLSDEFDRFTAFENSAVRYCLGVDVCHGPGADVERCGKSFAHRAYRFSGKRKLQRGAPRRADGNQSFLCAHSVRGCFRHGGLWPHYCLRILPSCRFLFLHLVFSFLFAGLGNV